MLRYIATWIVVLALLEGAGACYQHHRRATHAAALASAKQKLGLR